MGNVLIKYRPEIYIQKYVETSDHTTFYNEVFQSLEWVQLDKGTISNEQAIDSVCKRLPLHLHEPAKNVFTKWYEKLELVEEMLPLIKNLKENGYNIYLLSNVAKTFHNYKDNIPAIKYFDGLFISSECGYLKPEKEIYTTFLNKFNLVPNECFFIDDMPINIDSAINVGMKGYIFKGNVKSLIANLKNNKINVSI